MPLPYIWFYGTYVIASLWTYGLHSTLELFQTVAEPQNDLKYSLFLHRRYAHVCAYFYHKGLVGTHKSSNPRRPQY